MLQEQFLLGRVNSQSDDTPRAIPELAGSLPPRMVWREEVN